MQRPGRVVDQHDAASRQREPRRRRRTRHATDSWRRTPPATTSTTLAVASRHGRPPRARSAAVTTTIRPTCGGAPQRGQGPGRGAADRRSRRASLSAPPIRAERPAATTITSAPRPSGRVGRPAAQSSRGWAKIIRPATVWRTRVTATSRSRSMCRAPPSTTIIVPSSRKPTPWPGLLALLDDPDAELLAGQDGGLDRVGQRVDVHDPDALQLGDPVEVEVVGQDDPAARAGQGHQLGVDLGHLGDVVLDDLDRRAGLLLHPVEDLEAAPAPVAAERVGAVGDVLQLVEHEARDDQGPVDEPGLDDLGDPAVDDRARIDHDPGVARGRPRARRRRRTAGTRPTASAATSRSRRLATVRPTMPEAQEDRDAERQPASRTVPRAPTAGSRAAGPSAGPAAGR